MQESNKVSENLDINFLIDVFSETLGLETAEKIIYESVEKSNLVRKKYYDENEFKLICDTLKQKGGYIKIIAEMLLKSANRDIYYREQLLKERREKEELINLKCELEKRTKELEETLQKMNIMQEQLIRSEKLATIGKLSSIVAHELRNPLTSINNIAYYLLRSVRFEDEKSKYMINMLTTVVERVNRIVNDLVDFSRIKKLSKSEVNMKVLIDNILSEIKIPETIKIIKDIDELIVNVDIERMRQVILNLVTNAIDAIIDKGEIKIKVKEYNNQCIIVISDNGVGMDSDTVSHLFEPLFTTKIKGLGLGLTVVKEIIDAHNGNIIVKSEKNLGTEFTISLPIY